MAVTSIRDETPPCLTLIGVEEERLVLAPLQEKAIGDVSAFDFEDAARDGIVSLGEDAPRGLSEKIGGVLDAGAIRVFVVGVGLSGQAPPWEMSPVMWSVIAWSVPAAILLAVAAVLVIRGTNSSVLVTRIAAQLTAQVLLPQPTARVFGFLGVYFFSLRLIALRYARGVLKPKAYTQIMARIFIVAVLSWVLDAIFKGDSTTKLVLAFLFGITPDEFFTWLREAFRGRMPSKFFPEPTRSPLNDLEGIDLYDLGRLESEGIVNIEGLAHHELIDRILVTRVPVPRLIDRVDQSMLYLHLVGGSESGARKDSRIDLLISYLPPGRVLGQVAQAASLGSDPVASVLIARNGVASLVPTRDDSYALLGLVGLEREAAGVAGG